MHSGTHITDMTCKKYTCTHNMLKHTGPCTRHRTHARIQRTHTCTHTCVCMCCMHNCYTKLLQRTYVIVLHMYVCARGVHACRMCTRIDMYTGGYANMCQCACDWHIPLAGRPFTHTYIAHFNKHNHGPYFTDGGASVVGFHYFDRKMFLPPCGKTLLSSGVGRNVWGPHGKQYTKKSYKVGVGGHRSPYLLYAKQALYHLSYDPGGELRELNPRPLAP